MNPIPIKYRKAANENPFYKICCCCGDSPVEWHHPLIVARKQIAEIFLPACEKCHGPSICKKAFEWMAINMYYNYLVINYSKRNWKQRREYLNGIYGEYHGEMGIEL